jgi:RimJ/RimL family protein N-acetyltransferase
MILETAKGPVVFRPERPEDEALLYTLFRSWALPDLALMPADDATKEALVQMQFRAQMVGYRAQFPEARFDIVEQEGEPVGRFVIDPGGTTQPVCFVDFVLLPERRRNGLGKAITNALLERYRREARKVRLKVLQYNLPSHRLWFGAGFVQIGEHPPFLQLEWTP